MRAPRRTGMIVLTLLLLGLSPNISSGTETAPDRSIQLYQQMLQRNPRDARTYFRLGDVYIRKARETGDVTYFNLAEQALRRALTISPDYSDAARHLAFALYSKHAFDEAALQATKAIELNPRDSHAYGILGDALLETGRYDQAREAYQKMIRLDRDLYSYTRLSGLKSLRGDTAGAVQDLMRAIRAGKDNRRPKESIAWAQWQLGNEHFALGHVKQAEAQYGEALATYPNYYRAMAGLAQIRGAQQRYPEAIDLYHQALAVIPMPEYAAALGDVYREIGRSEEAKKQFDLVEYIGDLTAFNKTLYNRELAYFYADHGMKLKEALELAQKELEVRKDIYAYDLLAWALLKNEKPQEARAAMAEALKPGTRDARLFYHAGMIQHRLGNRDAAKAYLQRALQTNPHFHLIHAKVAQQTLKELDRGPRLALAGEETHGR